MATNDYLPQILHRFNQWLAGRSVRLSLDNTIFIRDSDVEYTAEKYRVRREQLITSEQFSEALAPLLAGGPSWIHANAIPFGDGRFLITVIVGAKIGNPRPSINVSYEPEKQAEIISEKVLVMTN